MCHSHWEVMGSLANVSCRVSFYFADCWFRRKNANIEYLMICSGRWFQSNQWGIYPLKNSGMNPTRLKEIKRDMVLCSQHWNSWLVHWLVVSNKTWWYRLYIYIHIYIIYIYTQPQRGFIQQFWRSESDRWRFGWPARGGPNFVAVAEILWPLNLLKQRIQYVLANVFKLLRRCLGKWLRIEHETHIATGGSYHGKCSAGCAGWEDGGWACVVLLPDMSQSVLGYMIVYVCLQVYAHANNIVMFDGWWFQCLFLSERIWLYNIV